MYTESGRIYSRDEQVRRREGEGRAARYEHWEFLRPVLDASGGEPRCVVPRNN